MALWRASGGSKKIWGSLHYAGIVLSVCGCAWFQVFWGLIFEIVFRVGGLLVLGCWSHSCHHIVRYIPQQSEGKYLKGGGGKGLIIYCWKGQANLTKYYGRMTKLLPLNLQVTLSQWLFTMSQLDLPQCTATSWHSVAIAFVWQNWAAFCQYNFIGLSATYCGTYYGQTATTCRMATCMHDECCWCTLGLYIILHRFVS